MGALFNRWSRIVIGNTEILNKDGAGLKVNFSVTRSLAGQPNTATLDVYNLSKAHRGEIEQRLANEAKLPKLKIFPVSIEAGYGSDGEDAELIFLGHLRSFITTREGPDLITHLGSGDGELPIKKSRVALSFKPGTPTPEAFRQLAESLGVERGNLDDAVKLLSSRRVYPSGAVFSGSAARELTAACRSLGLEWSVQNGALQILERGKALAGKAVVLNENTGMLGEPSIDTQGIISVSSLMIKGLYPGRLMVVQGERLKGQYKIVETVHNGDTSGGPWEVQIKGRRY